MSWPVLPTIFNGWTVWFDAKDRTAATTAVLLAVALPVVRPVVRLVVLRVVNQEDLAMVALIRSPIPLVLPVAVAATAALAMEALILSLILLDPVPVNLSRPPVADRCTGPPMLPA